MVTKAPVDRPLPPFDDDADRRRLEHCGIKAATPPWELGHPPQHTARAVRGPVGCTRLLFALATADRRPCEREARGDEPVGWPRWQRQLLPQHREQRIVWAQGFYGLFPMAEFALWLGGKRKDVPPGSGTRQETLAPYGRTSHA